MSKKRKVAVLSTGRQDFGCLRSILHLLRNDDAFELQLLAGGMHLVQRFGRTITHIRSEGFDPAMELTFINNDNLDDISSQSATAMSMVTDALRQLRPDFLVLLGDRYETCAAALSATLERVPLVHIHGGEETQGAIDNVLRHAISKMSHLHLVCHDQYARRLRQLGEDPASIHVVGAPGLDNLLRDDLPNGEDLARDLQIELSSPLVIVTLHPETLAQGEQDDNVEKMLQALDTVKATYVITLPNSDPGNEQIRQRLVKWASVDNSTIAVEALGEQRYFALMRIADAMIGNSSSAIIEAPTIGLPAVNIGDRQRGRLCGSNTIHVPSETNAIRSALAKALSTEFRNEIRKDPSPFGQGRSGNRILDVLKSWQPPKSLVKPFFDLGKAEWNK